MTGLIDIATYLWILGTPAMFVIIVLALLRIRRVRPHVLFSCALLFGYIVFATLTPQRIEIPVEGASKTDWNSKSFWYEPWGASIVHRGIDIFAKSGTHVLSPSPMFVVWTGSNPFSGKFIVGIDPYSRLHFFAHLDKVLTSRWTVQLAGNSIGTVGDSGNARGKAPHLHYGIASVIPRFWLITEQTLGHLRAFYLDPVEFFR